MRCTQATLEALNIKGKCPKTGAGVIQAIRDAGLRYRVCDELYNRKVTTVQQFVASHLTGKYYLSTAGHAMALVDGQLTDTTGRGIDRRHVGIAVEIL
jgi:hypothetical protein